MSSQILFPPVDQASPEGILAIGGDLAPETLLTAYLQGIFPWPISSQIPLAWFAPNPRGVLLTENLHIPRKVQARIRRKEYQIRFNSAFEEVITECAKTSNRPGQTETWITPSIIRAYTNLHGLGFAYSVETYCQDKLVGGVYGVNIGQLVSGESMFYKQNDASKIALIALIQKMKELGIPLLDTQMITPVVSSLGGIEISREEYMERLSLLQVEDYKGLISSL